MSTFPTEVHDSAEGANSTARQAARAASCRRLARRNAEASRPHVFASSGWPAAACSAAAISASRGFGCGTGASGWAGAAAGAGRLNRGRDRMGASAPKSQDQKQAISCHRSELFVSLLVRMERTEIEQLDRPLAIIRHALDGPIDGDRVRQHRHSSRPNGRTLKHAGPVLAWTRLFGEARMNDPYLEIERVVRAALVNYSNVHRGSGHHALATSRLYDHAKDVVLDCLGLSRRKYVVVFCSPRRAAKLAELLPLGTYQIVSSQELGLPFGIRAVAVQRKALPAGMPFEAGGGTARLISTDWAIWANGAERFEAGTPAIVNAIAFARALQVRHHEGGAFTGAVTSAASDDGILDGFAGRDLLARLRQTLIGCDANVPTTAGSRAYVESGQCCQHAHVYAHLGRCPSGMAAFSAAWTSTRRQGEGNLRRLSARAACNLRHHLHLEHDGGHQPGRREYEQSQRPDHEPVVLTTYLEHNSNELPWRSVQGDKLIRLAVDPEGAIHLVDLETHLRAYNHEHTHGRQRITLVAVSGASNVLGVFPPLPEIARLARQYGAQVLVDAAQLVAHHPIDMEAWGIDYLAFSGHKVYAPFGTGALVARKALLSFSATELATISTSGEENIGGIAALDCALSLLARIGFDVIHEEEQALLRRTLAGLAELPRVRVYGTRDPASPRLGQKSGIVIFGVKRRLPSRVARELAERAGVGVRYGCHCAHLLIKRLLKVPRWAERLQYLMLTLSSGMSLPGVVRVSFGLQTTAKDVDTFLDALKDIVNRASKGSPTKPFRRDMQSFVEAATRAVFAPLENPAFTAPAGVVAR